MNARIRTIAAALVACAVALPASAFAGEPVSTSASATAKVAAKEKGEKGERGKAKGKARFPVKAESFRKHVSKRVAKARTHLVKVLEHKPLSKEAEAAIKKDFEANVVKINAAVDVVAKDGSVTKEEANSVRDLAKKLRKSMKLEGHGKGKSKA